MREFFHGWRRKMGLATLVLACILLAGWIRSDSLHDALLVPVRTSNVVGLLSADGQLGFYVTAYGSPCRIPKQQEWQTFKRETFKALFPAGAGFTWKWHYNSFGEIRHSSGAVFVWVIPYWSIVLPLTLQSAYLLLGKLRSKTKQAVPHA